MEIAVFVLFSAFLIGCLLSGLSIVYALIGGLFVFSFYALRKGFSFRALWDMCLSGVKTTKNILITFMLIGLLTALWRASGCIPTIVCYASKVIFPQYFVLLTFLLCCLVSILTGTSFGTSATMGVICVSIAKSLNVPLVPIGGAVLSGAFFGDRCSPMSTSALLVSTLSGSDIYKNIRNMIRTAFVPFLITCAVYYLIGAGYGNAANASDVTDAFYNEFRISLICLLPAAAVLIPALFKIGVKKLMLISILVSVPIALFLQKRSVPELALSLLSGFKASDPALSGLIDGGGLLSMVRVSSIVCLASCYSGIFRETGLTRSVDRLVEELNARIGTYRTSVIVSVPASAIGCNQTLAIMLTDQLASHLEPDPEKRALILEDSAVILSPLIPWSIASATPLATIGAPTKSLLFACYLYLLPLCRILWESFKAPRAKTPSAGTR